MKTPKTTGGNRTSEAVERMARDCQKGFVVLNDIPAVVAKYRLMEKELQNLKECAEEGGVNPKYLLARTTRALTYDPLTE